jgi:hypothetical protein
MLAEWLSNYYIQDKKIFLSILLSSIIILSIVTINNSAFYFRMASAQKSAGNSSPPYIGVNMRGLYTSGDQLKNTVSGSLPKNYYEDSFRLISQAGMNHVRYVFYWESYERNPSLFMNELMTMVNSADKWGVKVIYDNHQFHTSSWLNPDRGTGFPISLFKGKPVLYPYGAGGSPKYEAAKVWWTDWWNRSIKDTNGTDGWTLQANFLKKIVNAVDKHPSTLGYEILNEPQIHANTEWVKIGKFNTFMTDELRKVTQKIVFFSQQIPASINDPTVDLTPENMAAMAPANKTNVIFKFSSGYGVPSPGSYFSKRFAIYQKAGEILGIPIYIGEWNKVERQRTTNTQQNAPTFEINPEVSDITASEANLIVETFKKANVWGMAYWQWSFQTNKIPNFNLITVTPPTGTIQPTRYLDILKTAYSKSYGNTTITRVAQ